MKIVPLSKGEVQEALFFEVASPYQAPNFETGRYQVVVRALDKAGNTHDESVTMNILSRWAFIPWEMVISGLLSALIVILLIIFILWRQHRHHLPHAFREDLRRIFPFMKKPPTAPALILALAIFGGVELVSAQEILVAPEIYYPLEDVLYLDGRADPNSRLELLLTQPEAKPVLLEIVVNEKGEWNFRKNLKLADGFWLAKVRLANGESNWSEPKAIQSVMNGYYLGSIGLQYVSVAILLSGALAFFGFVVIYLLIKAKKIGKIHRR
jgi:hypothetical protein